MKKSLLIALGLALAPMANADKVDLKTTEQKASYALATDIASNFRQQGFNIDAKAFSLGLEDSLKDRTPRLTEKEMVAAIDKLKERIRNKQIDQRRATSDQNLKKGTEFLAANAKKPNVKKLQGGIQYKVITEGKGSSPTENDSITAHYRGTLIDGTEFDSSYSRGKPFIFQMNRVIKGWGIALKEMKPGSKWEVYIPTDMAYGKRGAGESIGPNEALIFTIELIKFDAVKK
ncbi:MAG: FKBP-type peptidyl-prolyl cis-trans isomerase FklB [Thiomicrorhabdus sp.]|nr:MAG: FKBP-type peptidyl-prolyl cis-trans isomerase FklB [Thiomicrorhabdus sp.]